MIKAAADHIGVILGNQVVTDILGEAQVFWELAEPGTLNPFITYSVSSNLVTKSRLREYNTTLRIFDDSLTKASMKAEVIEAYIENSEAAKWKFRGSTSGYTSSEAKTAFIEIQYNFKL